VVARVTAVALLAAGTLLAGTPPASGVRGKLTGWERLVPQAYLEASKPDSHRYTWREPSPTVKQDFRRLSANVSREVCVAALGGAPAQPHEPYIVRIAGGRATPATLVVSLGSRLSLKNLDPFPHQLYELNAPSWAPNPTAPGSTREWAAASPGTHQIRDQLFPSLVLYVVVDAQAVEFASPDHEGSFWLPLPAGDYTLRAFFDGKPVGRALEGVHVSERGFELKEPLSLGGESK
jgi:hypothetical protein